MDVPVAVYGECRREWVVDHLIVTDKAMKARLSKYPKNFQ